MRKILMSCAACCVAAGLAAVTVLPQDPTQPSQQPPEADPMMEAWMQHATPGEHHEHLNAFVGQWDISTRFRMGPDQPWEESTAEANAKWVLGNRYVYQHVTAPPDDMMPEGFEGILYLGYDNYKNKHTALWMDSMSTMTLFYTGQCSEDGKTFTFTSEYDDPFTGTTKRSKWVYRLKSEDEIVMEMHEPDMNDEMFLMGEITYKRAED